LVLVVLLPLAVIARGPPLAETVTARIVRRLCLPVALTYRVVPR
jgi:hypothetical protein